MEGTSTLERVSASAGAAAMNPSTLPPLVEEVSTITTATSTDAAPHQPTADAADLTSSTDAGTDGFDNGAARKSSTGVGTPQEVPQPHQAQVNMRPKSVPSSPQQASKLAKTSPRTSYCYRLQRCTTD